MRGSRDSRAAMRLALALAAIIALAATLTLYRLGAADVCGFNEAVEGVFVQQMVEHGELLFPLDNGRAPLYKPPLFHWSAVALDRLGGVRRVTAFNLRLPAALYAVAGVVLTTVFAYDLLGLAGAVTAGLILCASYQYVANARIGRVDMTLSFFETLAMFAFAWWLTAGRPADSASPTGAGPADAGTPPPNGALRYLFGAALGCAVLAKGPVGAFLPAAAAGIFLILARRFTDLRRLATPGPVTLALVIGMSWYAACYFNGRHSFLDRQLGSENFGRFFGALGAMPPWYYLQPLLLNSIPFSLLAPFAVAAALRRGHPTTRIALTARLLAIFWIVTVVFFSVAAYKRRAYLLPLWPATAVLIAAFTSRLAQRPRGGRVVRLAMVAAAAITIGFNFYYLPRKEIRDCGNDSMRTTAAQINRIVGRDEPLYSYKLGDEPATLIFYLGRNVPPLAARLGDAPPGYVILPVAVWRAEYESAPGWTPVLVATSGKPRLVLLRHGAALARRW